MNLYKYLRSKSWRRRGTKLLREVPSVLAMLVGFRLADYFWPMNRSLESVVVTSIVLCVVALWASGLLSWRARAKQQQLHTFTAVATSSSYHTVEFVTLDGRALEHGDLVELAWPNGETELVAVRIRKLMNSSGEAGPEGSCDNPYTLTLQAVADVIHEGGLAQIDLRFADVRGRWVE